MRRGFSFCTLHKSVISTGGVAEVEKPAFEPLRKSCLYGARMRIRSLASVVVLPLALVLIDVPLQFGQAQTAQDLSQYVGLYRSAGTPDAVNAVYVKDGALFFDSERTIPSKLQGEATDSFTVPGASTHVQFQRDSSGKIRAMVFVKDSMTNVLDRFSDVAAPLNHGLTYTKTEAMVPVRDGVKLHVVILRPQGSENQGPPLPFVITRTPYGADGSNASVNFSKPELAASGYIFVIGDIRGRFGSEGQFVMNRPVVHTYGDRSDTKLVDESSDVYDTVAWLLKNVPNNNGRVGVTGISYPGFLAIMAGIDHHPAVKAISPQAPMTDVWMGDDFFHNGAFRETYGFDYVQELERGKENETVSMDEDTFDYFLKRVNFAGAAKAAGMTELPTAREFLTQPSYTKVWRDRAVQERLSQIEVPTLEVGGWFDQEDMWGTQAEYAALRPHDTKSDPLHRVFLVLGPWNHGGWGATTRRLGEVDFGSSTGDIYRKTIEAPFFEYYLKDKPGFALQDTASFRTGVNEWERYDVWPPKAGFHAAKLYLGGDAGVSLVAPAASSKGKEFAEYVSDPANPIPYRERPIESTYGKDSKWRPWLSNDQSFLKDRKDIARFESPVLDHDLTVTGNVVADLFASTTGSDADWVVKLIDVYPDDTPASMGGYRLMIVDEIFRARYAKSFETPHPIEANKVSEYRWGLHGADHTFKKGHRMLVEVQSTWFPLYDRNPQTFVPNIMSAPAEAYKAQTMRVYTSAQYPSHLDVLQPDDEK